MIDEKEIQSIVERVLSRVKQGGPVAAPSASAPRPGACLGSGIFADLESAISAARAAQQTLAAQGKEKRRQYIQALREVYRKEARRLAELAVQDTKMGNVPDKIAKNMLCADKSPGVENLEAKIFTGENGVTYDEWVPYGVIGSLTPCTNPTSTIVNHSIIMLSGGNAVVFCPHPAAVVSTLDAIQVGNRAIVAAGGPDNLLVAVAEPTLRVAKELMTHPRIDLLVVTGGAAVVKAGLQSGKRAICAGPGNPPSVVDETADLAKAARYIVDGSSFDNNMPCICDKECYAVRDIADRLLDSMQQCGAFLVSASQTKQLEQVVLSEGHPSRDYIGKDASVILKAIGVNAPAGTKLIVCETDQSHPFVQEELMMPLLPLVRVANFEEGMQKAKEAEHGFRHTAIIHSNDMQRVTRFAREMAVTMLVVNGMCGNVLGAQGEGYCGMTIAGTTGEGITTPKTFCRPRRLTFKDQLNV